MPQSEVAFLLALLNKEWPEGRLDEDHPYHYMQLMIIHRFFVLGLWVECHPDRHQWYAHVNDEIGMWEQ